MFFENDEGEQLTYEEVESLSPEEKANVWSVVDIEDMWDVDKIDDLENLPPWKNSLRAGLL